MYESVRIQILHEWWESKIVKSASWSDVSVLRLSVSLLSHKLILYSFLISLSIYKENMGFMSYFILSSLYATICDLIAPRGWGVLDMNGSAPTTSRFYHASSIVFGQSWKCAQAQCMFCYIVIVSISATLWSRALLFIIRILIIAWLISMCFWCVIQWFCIVYVYKILICLVANIFIQQFVSHIGFQWTNILVCLRFTRWVEW